jgi:hypothetical protein
VRSTTSSAALWTGRHLAALGVTYALALALVGTGAYCAGGTGNQATCVRWLATSVCGLVVAGIGNGLWVSRGRRRLAQRRHQILAFHRPPKRGAGNRRTMHSPRPVVEPLLVTHRESTRYHREGCELVRGREVIHGSRVELETQGCLACAVCEP